MRTLTPFLQASRPTKRRKGNNAMTTAADIGYAIIAAQKIGLSQDQISQLSKAMYKAIDLTEEEHAETVYRETP